MVRMWSFNLTSPNTWYNLWNDLIAHDPQFDPLMSNKPFVPSQARELMYQNQTPGSNIQISDAKKEAGFILTGASWDRFSPSDNLIDLKTINVQSDLANTVLYVQITA